MRIGVVHNLPPGGAKRVLFHQVKGLSRKHRIYLYEYTSTDEDFLDIRPFCKKVIRYKFAIDPNENRLVKDYLNFIKLDNLNKIIAEDINNKGLEVCLVHPDNFTQSPFLLRYLKTPSVYYCHELLRIVYEKELAFDKNVIFIKKWYENSTRIIRKIIDRANARTATNILTNSYYTKIKIEKAYSRNSTVCQPGVDSKLFYYRKKKKKKVLFLGSWEKIDGYELAKNAIDKVRNELKFDFKQIVFSKRFKDEELVKEYSESAAVICTSFNEPFGLIALESMACETPVLAVNEGGYRESVVDGITGYLLPRDSNLFAERIKFLLNNPTVAKRMGKAARNHVKKDFNWDKHVKCVEKHLYDLTRQKRR